MEPPLQPKPFYFSYQLRIELIPYIHEETQEFAQYCKEVSEESPGYQQVLALAGKRREDLEGFYSKYYMDFRATLIVETINLMRIVLCGLMRNNTQKKRRVKNQNKEDVRHEQKQEEAIRGKHDLKKQTKQPNHRTPSQIPNPKHSVLVKSSSTVLKIANKKDTSSTKSIDFQKQKTPSLSKLPDPANKLANPRKSSHQVSSQLTPKLGSSKLQETKDKKQKETKSKPMSKSQYMTYLSHKQGQSK